MTQRIYSLFFGILGMFPGLVVGQSFDSDVASLIEDSCIHCHDATTVTRLNFETLGDDLADPETFRQWEHVFDRIKSEEMPPESEPRPDPALVESALSGLKEALRFTNLAAQRDQGRVPARRLTKLEYGYTIQDLLGIEGDVSQLLPDEHDSGTFDTVGATQRISAVHVRSYLDAAEIALAAAIRLHANPYREYVFDFINSPFLNEFHEKPLDQGGNVTKRLSDGIALFLDIDYLLRANAHGFIVSTPGLYRIKTNVEAYQSKKPVTFKMILRKPSGNATLLGAFDLEPGKPKAIEIETYLEPGDTFYPTLANEGPAERIYGALFASRGAKNYKGKGIAIRSHQVEGPLLDSWPPPSTDALLYGTEIVSNNENIYRRFVPELSKAPIEHVREIVTQLAPRVFRRPPIDGEVESFVALAITPIEDGRTFEEVIRVPVRSMLTSPQFLFFGGEPGPLDDYALANRLSYFLWKSMPDDVLFAHAEAGELSEPEVLSAEVERMLEDPKSERFVRDFLGQWLRLYDINVTTPDANLYPEYDELLGWVLPQETELFFKELIQEDLPVHNLVDSDFTFVNRRLAAHYELDGVDGQELRRIELPEDSPRGGVLTHAGILKATANGTVTSPVTRGNFVLTNLLGTPPSPPPPGIGSIEPDTRGKITIREILAAHREVESCNQCHRLIDPPGFALESFDPIGRYRTKYRATANGLTRFFQQQAYRDGPPVDPSGVTADGEEFSGIDEFKESLLGQEEQIAKHLITQLVIYSTGGEIQFADREKIEAIVERTKPESFPVRSIIHEVVQSNLFRNK